MPPPQISVLLVALSLAFSQSLSAQEVSSEVTGFIEIKVAAGATVKIAPLFLPPAVAGGVIGAPPATNPTGRLNIDWKDIMDPDVLKFSAWLSTSATSKSAGSSLFGSPDTASNASPQTWLWSSVWARDANGDPNQAAILAPPPYAPVAGDVLRAVPFWQVNDLIGKPSAGLYAAAAPASADCFNFIDSPTF